MKRRNEDAGVRLGRFKREKTLPDFLVIGAQKAGTTWLHHNLRLHPQIWMPEGEVHYFDRKIKDARFSDEWY